MSLSQDDRIIISKKLVDIPKENAQSLDSKAKLEVVRVQNQMKDDANASLFTTLKTSLITRYQNEEANLNGNTRNILIDQDIIDAAQQKIRNYFFPNDSNQAPVGVPDGIWKNFIPYSGSKAIGKTYLGAFVSVIDNETQMIADLNALITTMESYTGIQRSTGLICTGISTLTTYTALHTTATSIINRVNDWKTILTNTVIVNDDPDTGKQTQNNTASTAIATALAALNSWLAYPDFDTSGTYATCVIFNGTNPFTKAATKFRSDVLVILKNEITARTAFIPTREGQLDVNLGSITQDMSTGNITASSGLYGDRFAIINLRLNLMAGSMRNLQAVTLGQKAQDEAIAFNGSAQTAYSAAVLVSAFRAPALGIDVIHIKDATGFNISDVVYVKSDTQDEITTSILGINGNSVHLANDIPAKYRQNEDARLYKVLI